MLILIVGGSSSVGLEAVRLFAERGDHVIATYTSAKPAQAEATWLTLDLNEPHSFRPFADGLRQTGLSINHLILMSGILPGMPLSEYTPDLMNSVMSVNFTGPALLIQQLLPLMAANGSMLAISSISAQQGSFDPIYAASKAAIVLFMKSLASASTNGIRFNCLAPGLIEDSTMYLAMRPERRQMHRDQTPSGKLLALKDFARAVVELTDDKWMQMNGAVISLNGGRFV